MFGLRSTPFALIFFQTCRCYICDDEVHYSRTGHLAQLVTNIQKQTSVDPIKRPQSSKYLFIYLFLSNCISGIPDSYRHVVFGCLGVKEGDSLLDVDQKTGTVKAEESEDNENKGHQKKTVKKESVAISKKSDCPEDGGGVSVKGLSNLGNTCFFNAVIQVSRCFIGHQS